MGKDSLIKSTDKKLSGTKKEAGKTKQKSTKKIETKTKTPKTAAKKSSAKKTPVKAKGKSKAKTVAIKDLILKKFEPLAAPVVASAPPKPAKLPDAPPIIATSDAKEAERLRKLLFAKFSINDIKAAAKPPEQTRAPEAKPAPKPAAKPEAIPAAEPKADAVARPVREPEDDIKPVVTADSDDFSDERPDPMKKIIKYAVAGFALILLLIIGTSAKNNAKFYVKTNQDAIEIWRGNFSPTGQSLFLSLPGIQAPQEEKTIYSREEVFPLAFNYYLGKADSLLDEPGQPDYEKIKAYARQASQFAITGEMTQAVKTRLNSIDRMPLLIKADVALSKGTADSLDAAVVYLKKAEKLTSDPAQLEIIHQKIEAAKQAKAALNAQPIAH